MLHVWDCELAPARRLMPCPGCDWKPCAFTKRLQDSNAQPRSSKGLSTRIVPPLWLLLGRLPEMMLARSRHGAQAYMFYGPRFIMYPRAAFHTTPACWEVISDALTRASGMRNTTLESLPSFSQEKRLRTYSEVCDHRVNSLWVVP